jgi:hypothetical protein
MDDTLQWVYRHQGGHPDDSINWEQVHAPGKPSCDLDLHRLEFMRYLVELGVVTDKLRLGEGLTWLKE